MNDDAFDQYLMRFEPQLPSSAERYGRLRAKLIKFFEWNHCEDPEGLADETIGRLVKKIYSGVEIDKAWSYALAVASNVFKEHLRKQSRMVQLQDEWDFEAEEFKDRADFVECARHCLAKLADDKRLVLEQYYSDEGGREEAAGRLGCSLAALRLRIHRVRAEVRDCYQKCIGGSGTRSN